MKAPTVVGGIVRMVEFHFCRKCFCEINCSTDEYKRIEDKRTGEIEYYHITCPPLKQKPEP